MLLPRYSLRTLFIIAFALAIGSVVVGQAVRGADWAIALSIGIGSLGVSWLVFALFYAIVTVFAWVALPAELKTPKPAYYPDILPPASPPVASSPSDSPASESPASEMSDA